MGCCSSDQIAVLKECLNKEKIKQIIDMKSIKRFATVYHLASKLYKGNLIEFFNNQIIEVRFFSMNALAYCIFRGEEKIFKFLYDKGASLRLSERLFESQNIKAINIICQQGHLDLLKIYLPIYLQSSKHSSIINDHSTLDFTDRQEKPVFTELPIQSACRTGMVQIISYLYNYFLQMASVPKDFSLKAVNEYYGEDSSLVACRYGCFPLIKFMHEQCGCKFNTYNKYKENALLVCICGFKKKPHFSYMECINYLIDVVQVDVTYMYEEMLVAADDQELVDYLEAQLEKKGITCKKKDIDKAISYAAAGNDVEFIDDVIFNTDFRENAKLGTSFPSSISSRCTEKLRDSSIIDILGK